MRRLAEELMSLIEGPLNEEKVTEDMVREKLSIPQNERRMVYGVPAYRDGDGSYFINNDTKPLGRREAIKAIGEALHDMGKELDENFALKALMKADADQQAVVDKAETEIGEKLKKVAKKYVAELNRMTGAKWKVVSASRDIFSLDSDEKPKRSIDIFWEFDPGSLMATIFVEGPNGSQKVYSKQKVSDVDKKNYVDWLKNVLKEEMGGILAMALQDDTESEQDDPISEHASLINDFSSIIQEASEGVRRRPVSETDERTSKPLTTVSRRFRQLIRAAGDESSTQQVFTEELRRLGVSMEHIDYALNTRRIPWQYADAFDVR